MHLLYSTYDYRFSLTVFACKLKFYNRLHIAIIEGDNCLKRIQFPRAREISLQFARELSKAKSKAAQQ